MKTKISSVLIGLACVIMITTAIYLGSMSGTQILVASTTTGASLAGGFYFLRNDGGIKKPD